MSSARIVVVGSINTDLSVLCERHPEAGETLSGTSVNYNPGGKGANQAAAAALLGADVAFVGAVGDDLNRGVALSLMEEAGVATDAIEEVDAPTGLAIVQVDAEGENRIIVISGANSHVDGDFVRKHADVISHADVVIAQGEIPVSGIEAVAELTTGRFVFNLAPVVEVSEEALKKANPLIVNETEAELLLERVAPGSEVENYDDIASALYDWGLTSLAMTLGAIGSVIIDENGEKTKVSSAKVVAVDTTGAGDAFVGALAKELAEGKSLHEAALLASRVGAYSTTKYGAQSSYPREGESLPELR